MAEEYKLPDLGENVEGGDVLNVLVKSGQSIAEEESLLELETDKAVLEVPSTFTGTIQEILVKDGDHVTVGQTVLTYDPAQTAKDTGKKEAKRAEKPKSKEAEKKVGKKAAKAAQEAEQTEREKPAASRKPERKAPQPVPAARKHRETPAEPAGKVVEFSRPSPQESRQVAAAPSVRRLAREIGVDIHAVEGTGPRGRISRDDVKAHAQRRLSAGPTPVAPAGTLPDFSRWGEVRRERMSAVRRATAHHMARSWSQIPHVTQVDECDITDLEARRGHYAVQTESDGGKLTVTAIILKVLASALRKYPQFGASLDLSSEEIIYKDYIHIGVAVDTPRGLLVPVIRNADQKNIRQLSRELKELAGKARDAKLDLEEMQGGCITITNLGGIGGTSFSPVVNWPEVAILGVSRAATRPLHKGGDWIPRLVLPLSLSYDHRLIDGADAARFLRWICQALEEPFLLALEG